MSDNSSMNVAVVGIHDTTVPLRTENNRGDAVKQNSGKPPSKDVEVKKNRKEQLSDAITNLENSFNKEIRFEIDNELDAVIVKVVDKESGDVIRQIPSEELIELSKKIKGHKWHMLDVFA